MSRRAGLARSAVLSLTMVAVAALVPPPSAGSSPASSAATHAPAVPDALRDDRWLEHMLQKHTPPIIKNRRLKIRFMTQAKTRPPTFMLSSNISDIPDHYTRYLVGGLRESFGLKGVPVRLKIRKGKNPYGKEKD